MGDIGIFDGVLDIVTVPRCCYYCTMLGQILVPLVTNEVLHQVTEQAAINHSLKNTIFVLAGFSAVSKNRSVVVMCGSETDSKEDL
jgi:hypothetical protein